MAIEQLTRTFLLDQSDMTVKLLSCVQLYVTPWTVACQGPLSMGLPRQEYWIGLAFPFPGGSSSPRDWTPVTYLADRFFPTESPEKPKLTINLRKNYELLKAFKTLYNKWSYVWPRTMKRFALGVPVIISFWCLVFIIQWASGTF